MRSRVSECRAAIPKGARAPGRPSGVHLEGRVHTCHSLRHDCSSCRAPFRTRRRAHAEGDASFDRSREAAVAPLPQDVFSERVQEPVRPQRIPCGQSGSASSARPSRPRSTAPTLTERAPPGSAQSWHIARGGRRVRTPRIARPLSQPRTRPAPCSRARATPLREFRQGRPDRLASGSHEEDSPPRTRLRRRLVQHLGGPRRSSTSVP
jgi:hypothetical protein